MDKNSGNVPDGIWEGLAQGVPNVILCMDPFYKSEFLENLIGREKDEVIYVDLDLLYTGYVESGMLPRRDNVTVLRPERDSWNREISEVINTASASRCLVIVDSLNGIHGMHDDLESARFVNSCLMLLSSLARQAGSCVVIAAVARRRNEAWVLTPSGKQVLRSSGTRFYHLKETVTYDGPASGNVPTTAERFTVVKA